MFKPEGYTSLAPYLIVEDAAPLLAFIRAVFDAEPVMLHRTAEGGVGHAEIWIDDTLLMIGEWKGNAAAAHLHVYVPDVDASFARAVAAGGQVVQPPMQKDDADRRGGVRDPTGTTWWLATRQQPR